MAPVDFYYNELSTPSRAVKMLIKELDIEVNEIPINLGAGETRTEEFKQINPQHSVPAIVDDDLKLGESRAILCYLVNQYAPDNQLYPTDAKIRAKIDRYLYFDLGTLYSSLYNYYVHVFMGQKPSEKSGSNLENALKILEEFVPEGDEFLVGENYTIADISTAASLSLLDVTSFGYADCPKVEAYHARLKEKITSYEEINAVPVEKFKEIYDVKLAAASS